MAATAKLEVLVMLVELAGATATTTSTLIPRHFNSHFELLADVLFLQNQLVRGKYYKLYAIV